MCLPGSNDELHRGVLIAIHRAVLLEFTRILHVRDYADYFEITCMLVMGDEKRKLIFECLRNVRED